MDWQPIETAPKDGTIVLVYAPMWEWANAVHAARWDAAEHEGAWGHKWRHVTYQNLGSAVAGNPTHWLPMPPVPELGAPRYELTDAGRKAAAK